MHCALCGKLVTWLDWLARCRDCSTPPFNCFDTDLAPETDEAAEEAELEPVPV